MKIRLILFMVVLLGGTYAGLLPAQSLEIEYSTYLGGANYEWGEKEDIVLDSENRVYIAGLTNSTDFPTLNPYQSSNAGGNSDAMVTKLTSTGSALVYSTYIGGSGRDPSFGIALDSANQAYVIGYTDSSDFPTVNPYQASLPASGSQVYAFKLSSTGQTLVYSTYLGGSSSSSYGTGIAIDSQNQVYLTGYTYSTSFPVVNPYQSDLGEQDAFITKLSSSGSSLLFSTYLGGNLNDHGYGIIIDSSDHVYVAGETNSVDFPILNSYQSSHAGGYYDVFVTKLASSGSFLFYSTYLGGNGNDNPRGIQLDSATSAYLGGYTASSNFPVMNPYQSTYSGSIDAFISRLSSSGSSLLYSTYLGGGGQDRGQDIALDLVNRMYLVGWTESGDFPTANPYQAMLNGPRDAFVSRLSSSGLTLNYSTYLGGGQEEDGHGITIDLEEGAYVVGATTSTDFPTRNSYQSSSGGSSDIFVVKLKVPPTPTATPTSSPTPLPTPSSTSTPVPSPTVTPTPSPRPTITPAVSLTPMTTPSSTPGEISPHWIYDYNGDGTSDIAIFRPSSGLWAVKGITRVYFGGSTDEAVPGDYNGDGTTDMGIFRSSSGLWAIRGMTRAYFGSIDDLPEPGDYDGDGTADIGIYRSASGLWAIRGFTRTYFGGFIDTPASGYYDGDTTKDIGIYRGSAGLWAIRTITRIYFGSSSDIIVPGDYDGDKTWDYGIFRDFSGLWAIRGLTRIYFGKNLDQPVPADYMGDAMDDIGIFRESSGLWAIRGVTRVYFGGPDDIPVSR